MNRHATSYQIEITNNLVIAAGMARRWWPVIALSLLVLAVI
jgi:hypothetical protein